MIPAPVCPVCDSRYTVSVGMVMGRRSRRQFPQYICLDCQSFSNPSQYKEDESQLKADLDYVVERRDHIYKLQAQLFMEILHKAPGIQSVAEIGCGAGFFLKAAEDFGRQGVGFEVNPFAAQYARESVGVDVRQELFTEDHSGQYDLIVAIGVFEHLSAPRDLFRIMVSKLNSDGAIYLNVPVVNREHWRYLWGVESRADTAPPDPFYDNDVHITHFSNQGLVSLGRSFGARSWEFWESKDVVQNSAGAYPGILYRF